MQGSSAKVSSTRTIAILAYDSANAVDIFGPMQVFTTANSVIRENQNLNDDAYHAFLISSGQSTVTLSTGTQVVCDKLLSKLAPSALHTLLITGGHSARECAANSTLLRQLIELDNNTQRTVSVCTGAFILATMGALQNRRATTHWKYAHEFQNRFPNTLLEIDSIYTQDGKYSCSAGVTAGIDLALYLVQQDHGRRIALETAREMVAYYQRPGGQNQFASVLGTERCTSEALQRIQDWLHKNLHQKLDVNSLADKAHMSPRHFSRKFSGETGLSPARYLALARLNQARVLLEGSRHGISRVAALCGYSDPEIMRRLFLKELKVTPTEYRKRFSIPPQ